MEAEGRESERRDTLETVLTRSLLPFLASSAFYLFLWLPTEEPSWNRALARCLPILCLALFVYNSAPSDFYSRVILLGLLCSALGDIVYAWPNLFFLTLATYALAHLFYFAALGEHPIHQTVLGSVVAVIILYLAFLNLQLPSNVGFPVFVYAIILALMLCRALSRGGFAAFGGIFFSISVGIQAFDTLVRPLPSGSLMITVTYYIAQVLLALSAVEGRADHPILVDQ